MIAEGRRGPVQGEDSALLQQADTAPALFLIAIATQTEMVVYSIQTIPVVFPGPQIGDLWSRGGLSMLSELNIGESGVLVALDLPESVQNHLMHMGFVPDACVTALRRAPAGTPLSTALTGWRLPFALRLQRPSRFAKFRSAKSRQKIYEPRSWPRLEDELVLHDTGL